jgi:Fe2+ transport system protein FeoA
MPQAAKQGRELMESNAIPGSSDINIPLTALSNGQSARVAKLAGGEGFRHKVIALGILPGSIIRVRSYGRHGPIVVTVNETRVAVGRQLADRILVEPIETHVKHE